VFNDVVTPGKFDNMYTLRRKTPDAAARTALQCQPHGLLRRLRARHGEARRHGRQDRTAPAVRTGSPRPRCAPLVPARDSSASRTSRLRRLADRVQARLGSRTPLPPCVPLRSSHGRSARSRSAVTPWLAICGVVIGSKLLRDGGIKPISGFGNNRSPDS
jgi:hypothetical protein